MSVLVYHVTNQETGSKSLLTLNSKDDLMREIQTKFNCHDFLLQYEINEPTLGQLWIDVQSVANLPDVAKLLVIPRVQIQQTPETPTLSDPMMNSSAYDQTTPIRASNSGPSSISASSHNHLTFYRLPKFPRDIQAMLDAKDESIINNRSQRNKILSVLYQDLLEKTGW